MQKKFRWLLLIGVVALAGVVVAATLDGTVARMEAAGAGWSRAYDDQSDYPNQGRRHGSIIRFYDFSVDGGAAGAISLERGNMVTAVPDNTIIVGGFVDVITAVAPATSTNAISLNSAGDILAAGTTLNSAGVQAIVPDWSAANAVKLTNNMPCTLTISGSAATQGMFIVYLDCWYGQ